MSRLLVVRHGQSTWNADGRWQGHADVPLSELGVQQAASAAPAVGPIDGLWSSDLSRAQATANLLAPDGMDVAVDPRLRERDAGEWTGLTRAQIDEQYPGAVAERRSPPGFESDEVLLVRVLAAIDDIIGSIPGDAYVLVVTHGGVIRALERNFGAPPEPVPNLGGRVLEARPDGTVTLGARRLLIDPDEVAVTVPRQI